MGLAEKHPTDKGKYQATYSDYGHGKGNGKSRSMIYKEAKKLEIGKDTTEPPKEQPKSEKQPDYTKSQSDTVIEDDSFSDVSCLDEY